MSYRVKADGCSEQSSWKNCFQYRKHHTTTTVNIYISWIIQKSVSILSVGESLSSGRSTLAKTLSNESYIIGVAEILIYTSGWNVIEGEQLK